MHGTKANSNNFFTTYLLLSFSSGLGIILSYQSIKSHLGWTSYMLRLKLFATAAIF